MKSISFFKYLHFLDKPAKDDYLKKEIALTAIEAFVKELKQTMVVVNVPTIGT
ncbi:MAG: hypothetical protein WBB23_10520 [Desulforhopalus sp.]